MEVLVYAVGLAGLACARSRSTRFEMREVQQNDRRGNSWY